jgi:response regulator RpfG family c-di-GMP phosphodiesterase
MTQNSDKSKPLIYVVDDEPLLLELAITLLDSAYRIETFRNAESALAAFTQANPRPALVITDYSMHEMTGMDFIQECRRIRPNQKILMTSGTVDESIYRNSPAKPDRFLAKPYQPKQFVGLVERLLKSN